ncbi:conserved hypothetical protein [uncultured Alphaproteobacteria bacterium]|uniref:Uncharacterized protein n=1 Tax=uncultured Alphaproteobacteria bacterium TaxID=91750 RepID=A0A212JEP6_9PROT|nr:conserved hypothetical protein [uncultured Alphaproteobacteria bacterium]
MSEAIGGAALREALAASALADIPKLLTLLDRTPVSATYGCFDRAYWHYRMMDFPCGMSQVLVLPLALAWSLPIPGNPYYRQAAIRDWVEAGLRYAARSAHPDGSCDDYYPFERAAGAVAFSLFACLEAVRRLDLAGDPELDAFLIRRARWLAAHAESGRLSNHEALIVACLARIRARFGAEWEAPLRRRVERLLSWQSGEGWFVEYEGADPGYLSLTIAMIADADRLRPDLGLREPCRRAIGFLAALVHPDGTVGGEYTSRATLNYFPHGLEIAAAWMPEATTVNDRALRPLAEGRAPCLADDHIFGHHMWSRLLAWEDWREARFAAPETPVEGRTAYPEARLLVDRREGWALFLGWSRGGAFKLFRNDRLVRSDTGPTLRTRDGRVAVTHLEGAQEAELEADRIVVRGRMAWSKTARLTPFKSAVLRMVMLSGGRFFPDLIRALLQRILVTGRKDAPFRFERELTWRDGAWRLRDTVVAENGWGNVAAVGIGGFQTSVTTVMARVWQPSQLQPWQDLSDRLDNLGDGDPLVVDWTPDGRPQ